jgi:hypothetical protein
LEKEGAFGREDETRLPVLAKATKLKKTDGRMRKQDCSIRTCVKLMVDTVIWRWAKLREK